MRGSSRGVFRGMRLTYKGLCPNTFCSYVFLLSRELAEEDEDVFCVCKSSTGDRTFQTQGDWFYWSMDVLPTEGGSWLGLDGSMSARVQLAVGGF